MMAAEARTDEDGALQPALQALGDAVRGLCDPQHQYLESRLITIPSLYLQLMDSVTGEQVNTGGGGGSKSRPPLWLDALDLLAEIDVALEIWQPAYTGVPASVGRMHWLLQRKWRPQDVNRIQDLTNNLRQWAQLIDQKLNPTPKLTLPNPCPACDVAIVYRKDGCGEPVKKPALQIVGKDGHHYCECLNCHYIWDSGRFHILAGALGYPLPPGVLE
jgi:hypothetical protein